MQQVINDTVDMMKLQSAHQAALQAARDATLDYLFEHGERDCCGFAWVTSFEKGNTKMGRALKKLGFQKSFGGGYRLWNPSGHHTQALTAKERGAEAYVKTMKSYFPELVMYDGSRMD